ncbi:hypothetical protein D9M68_810470 [compost metagenome]
MTSLVGLASAVVESLPSATLFFVVTTAPVPMATPWSALTAAPEPTAVLSVPVDVGAT